MREPQAGSARVGVQELRRNLSVYLDRVREGERLVVTEHGRAVAELGPLTPNSVSVLERLVAEGRARGAKRRPADPDPPAGRARRPRQPRGPGPAGGPRGGLQWTACDGIRPRDRGPKRAIGGRVTSAGRR